MNTYTAFVLIIVITCIFSIIVTEKSLKNRISELNKSEQLNVDNSKTNITTNNFMMTPPKTGGMFGKNFYN
jgi:hypothetical protein